MAGSVQILWGRGMRTPLFACPRRQEQALHCGEIKLVFILLKSDFESLEKVFLAEEALDGQVFSEHDGHVDSNFHIWHKQLNVGEIPVK